MGVAAPSPIQQYVSIQQVATALGVDTKTVRRRIAEGVLPAVKIGSPPRSPIRDNRPIRIPREALDAIIEPVTVAATPGRATLL